MTGQLVVPSIAVNGDINFTGTLFKNGVAFSGGAPTFASVSLASVFYSTDIGNQCYLVFSGSSNNQNGIFINVDPTNRTNNYIQLPSAGTYRVWITVACGLYGRIAYTKNYETFGIQTNTIPGVSGNNTGIVTCNALGANASQISMYDIYVTSSSNDRLRFFHWLNTNNTVPDSNANPIGGTSKIIIEKIA
jgi:hypothetical protein